MDNNFEENNLDEEDSLTKKAFLPILQTTGDSEMLDEVESLTKNEPDYKCAICQDSYPVKLVYPTMNDDVICEHVFHKECFLHWFEKNKDLYGNTKCPLCVRFCNGCTSCENPFECESNEYGKFKSILDHNNNLSKNIMVSLIIPYVVGQCGAQREEIEDFVSIYTDKSFTLTDFRTVVTNLKDSYRVNDNFHLDLDEQLPGLNIYLKAKIKTLEAVVREKNTKIEVCGKKETDLKNLVQEKDAEIERLEKYKLNVQPTSETFKRLRDENLSSGQIANQSINLALIRALKDKHCGFPVFDLEEYKNIYDWVSAKTSKMVFSKLIDRLWSDWLRGLVLAAAASPGYNELSKDEKLSYVPYIIADRLTSQRPGGIFYHFEAFPFEDVMRSTEAKKREFSSDDQIIFFKFKRIVEYCRSWLKKNAN